MNVNDEQKPIPMFETQPPLSTINKKNNQNIASSQLTVATRSKSLNKMTAKQKMVMETVSAVNIKKSRVRRQPISLA